MNKNVNRYWGSVVPPAAKREFFDAVTTPAPAGDGTVATLRLYGPIDSWGGWWGISASDVSDVLDGLPESVSEIVLRINSPGGEVFEGVSILNMLRAHSARVVAVVDGLAASAASVIAAGCDETVMSPGTQMMIHSPSSIVWGNAEDMRKTATVLDSVEASIVEIYEGKAGVSDWGKLLADETWLTAKGAVELGLADRVGVVKDAGTMETVGGDEPDLPDGDDVENVVHLRFAAYAARLSAQVPPSSSEAGNPNQKEALAMSDALKAGLTARLGVTDAEITDEALLAAVDEALAEQTDNATPVASIPAGTQLIESNVLEQMRADAAAGREAREEQIKARRDGVISDALREGRIAPSSAEGFRAMLDADEATATATIQSLAANTVPVAEIGHAAGEVTADEANYAAIYGQKEA